MRDEAWKKRAVCLNADPDLFFPELGQNAQAARKLCAVCPVQIECLDYAVDNDLKYGVWGGVSGSELQRYRRRQRRA